MWSPRTFYRVLWYSTHGMELARVLFVLAMALLFVAGGIAWSLRPPVEAEPVAFTPTDAARLRDGDPPRLVRVAAELEPRVRIYRSGGPVPYWSRCPPSRVAELSPGELTPDTADRWLGCRVTVAGSLADAVRNGRLTRLETQVETPTPEGVARWLRLIAPLEAYGPGVYVASPQLRADGTDAEEWLDRTRFTGLVAPATAFRDRVAREGYRDVSSTWLAGESRHVVVTADIDQPERAVELFSASAWAPVSGFGTRLLVKVGPAMPVAPGGPIVGVLETLSATDPEAGELLGLSLLLGEPLPEVFGVIRTASADAFNERREGIARLFIILGLLGAAAASGAVALWIVGPGLIYDAWMRAFEELEEIRTNAGSPARPAGGRSDLLGVAASPGPVNHTPPRQPVSATDEVADSTSTAPRFLALVQDVSSPAGGGAWCLWRVRDDLDTAADDAANSGQRFPCLVVELLGRSGRRTVSQDEGLPAYSAFRGDLLLLRHSPRALERDRFVLVDVLDGSEPDAAERARVWLDREHVLAMAVRLHLADDSEHGPTVAVEKSADSPVVRGVGALRAGPSPDRR